jgi:hypothetical protein
VQSNLHNNLRNNLQGFTALHAHAANKRQLPHRQHPASRQACTSIQHDSPVDPSTQPDEHIPSATSYDTSPLGAAQIACCSRMTPKCKAGTESQACKPTPLQRPVQQCSPNTDKPTPNQRQAPLNQRQGVSTMNRCKGARPQHGCAKHKGCAVYRRRVQPLTYVTAPSV